MFVASVNVVLDLHARQEIRVGLFARCWRVGQELKISRNWIPNRLGKSCDRA